MASTDFNSSQPVRTESNGDVVVKLVDSTVTSQGVAVDAAGRLAVKLDDGSGNAISSTTINSAQWLDVVQPSHGANGSATPGYSNLVGGSDGTNVRPLKVSSTGSLSVTLNDSAGNAITEGQKTMALSLPVVIASDQSHFPVELQDNAGNGLTSTAINSKQTLDANLPSSGVNGSAVPYGVNVVAGSDGTNARSIATDASGKVKVDLNDATGNPFSSTNPLPVLISASIPGAAINDYNASTSNVAAGSSDNHDYTITATKTFLGKKFTMSASGRARFDIQISPDGTTFTTKFTLWTTASCPTIQVDMGEMSISDAGTGSKIRIVRTNEDKQPFGLYSTICGTEQ